MGEWVGWGRESRGGEGEEGKWEKEGEKNKGVQDEGRLRKGGGV